MVRTGLDVAPCWLRGDSPEPSLRAAAGLLRRGCLGLVTNPSAVTGTLAAAPDALRDAGARLAALFGPEHGVRGDVPDGIRVPHGTDRRTGVPAWSLYGPALAPTQEMLAGLDALVFDIQDIGARFYTFASTLSHLMAAAGVQVPVIVLDRPNPLGGLDIEGPVLEPRHASFLGLHPIPVRHGATIGELGRLWARFGAGAEPMVVPCEGWERSRRWDETGLQWVPPSPNMPSFETALLYPGMCLLEGTNVSEGRGTACPFRWFGAPWVDAESLAERLNGAGLSGLRFRPVRFLPSASKFSGQPCSGCQVHLLDAASALPVAACVAVLAALREGYPEHFEWRENEGRYSVDRLAGTASLREAVDAGKDWREISAGWSGGVEGYRELLQEESLYPCG